MLFKSFASELPVQLQPRYSLKCRFLHLAISYRCDFGVEMLVVVCKGKVEMLSSGCCPVYRKVFREGEHSSFWLLLHLLLPAAMPPVCC